MSVQNVIAVVFDCDDTLCPDTITYLLNQYAIDPHGFWQEVETDVRAGMDPPLAYMYKIAELVRSGKMHDLTHSRLRELGSRLQFFPGIPRVFGDLRRFIEKRPDFVDASVSIEFHVVTGGFEEMIKGSCIAEFMENIFGCTFEVDAQSGLLQRPKSIVTFTEKTKFIYAINKGISSHELREDPYHVNDSIREEDRRIPFRNMIYIGDGPSDIPCFSLIQKLGGGNGAIGHVIGVYRRGTSHKGYELARGRRITAGPFSTNYTRGSDLRKYLEQNILDIGFEIVRRRKITFRRGVRQS